MGKVKDQLKKIILAQKPLAVVYLMYYDFAIITSVLIVMLDSVTEYHNSYGDIFSGRVDFHYFIYY